MQKPQQDTSSTKTDNKHKARRATLKPARKVWRHERKHTEQSQQDSYTVYVRQSKKKKGEKVMDNIQVQKLAERLYNYVDPWDRDYETVDDIANDIKQDPLTVIEYLMDLLENA